MQLLHATDYSVAQPTGHHDDAPAKNGGRSWWSRWAARLVRRPSAPTDEPAAALDRPPVVPAQAAGVAAATDLPTLVEGMLEQGRYCLLLRPQITASLSTEQYGLARDALERAMANVPAGLVDLSRRDAESSAEGETLRHVEPLMLDRYQVTNRQFRQFVVAGGYDVLPLWDAEVWPVLAEFVDLTGTAGPRFWRSGRYPSGEDDHPVVGINWYEAVAYSRWVGKRLPTDSEWVKAAAWPVCLADNQVSQRRFPWGDVMDRGRCNVWGSGPGRTAAVTQFSTGVSVGGVYQLIGNVWEWTSGDFDGVDAEGEPLDLPTMLKTIHGGAFDTYFEHQACCDFQSGENPLSRKHNIGFRCALSRCDVGTAVVRTNPLTL
ncbi:MAG TPA: SUMF1/EgtB/PvdO family nonheme iron enzyme [Pirellulales bacterium]|nr:SUMF1/EgtB/PvdO family nonheme iron enzyme [Pirellulales bacterium]